MNFDKILLFRLLIIIKTLYQCGLCAPVEVAPILKIDVLNHFKETYANARLIQIDGQDHFRILDEEDATLYSNFFLTDFTSKSIEFDRLQDLELEIIYRRPDSKIGWFKCVFSEKRFIQAFFRRIYSFQYKGDGVIIFRIARYINETGQISRYVKNAHFYSKDITEFSNTFVNRIYFITHLTDMYGTVEADYIFYQKRFAVSDIYGNNKIALCIREIPEIRILISFAGVVSGQRFVNEYMPKALQHDRLVCEFPQNLTPEQISENLDEI